MMAGGELTDANVVSNVSARIGVRFPAIRLRPTSR
jgi:hypothetical protein